MEGPLEGGALEDEDDIDRSPSSGKRLGLAVTLLIGAMLASSMIAWRTQRWEPPALLMGVAACLAALAASRWTGARFYVAWMELGKRIGHVTGPVVLFAVWTLVVVPIALYLRLRRRDALERSFDPSAETYWRARKVQSDREVERDPEAPFRQY